MARRDPSLDTLLDLYGQVLVIDEAGDAGKGTLDIKTLKHGSASYDDMKAGTMAIAKGELRPKPGDPKVWFTSPESFAELLSNRNRALLAARCSLLAQISDTRPESRHELAPGTGRTPGNLSRTLRTMERYGLVRRHKGERGNCVPRCLTATCSLN